MQRQLTRKRPQETEAPNRQSAEVAAGARTHEELVDAEAGVDGDDAAAVVLHPPLHRGSRRVLRQQLRQALERVTSTEAVTSRAQGRSCNGEPANRWRRVLYLDSHGASASATRRQGRRTNARMRRRLPAKARRCALPPPGRSRERGVEWEWIKISGLGLGLCCSSFSWAKKTKKNIYI